MQSTTPKVSLCSIPYNDGIYNRNKWKKIIHSNFQEKEQRKNKDDDKDAILQQCVGPRLNFLDVGTQLPSFAPQDNSEGLVAFDINDYEFPVVTAHMTDGEAGQLSKDANVASVEMDGLMYAQSSVMNPEITDYTSNSSTLVDAQAPSAQAVIPWGVDRVKAPQCWEASKGDGITVAVLDTGIFPHRDLSGNLMGGISFVPGENWVDSQGHGTHVAGTIAAKSSGSIVGVAPSVNIFAIKVLSNSGSGQWSWLQNGLYWMRRYYGCTFDVANLSLGGASAPSTLRNFCAYAAQRTLLVCAAGNNGGSVIHPARYPECIAVSAIAGNNTIAGFSSRGPEVELTAPGVNVYSTLPGNLYGFKSGTSMAAPHVSGAAALCRGTHRGLDMDAIRSILKKHADNLGNPGKDDLYGYGLVDCRGSVYDKTCG